MKRRILSIFLVLALLLGLVPALPVAAEPLADGSYYDGPYRFSIYDGKATILEYEGNYEDDEIPALIKIPASLGGCPVTEIGYQAFQDCKAGKVILPDTVRTIGAYAFYRNEDIGTIILPDTLDVVGTYAFYGTNMEDVFYFPTVTQFVGYYGFAFVQCETIVLPEGMETIGEDLFAYTHNKNIVIPSSVKTVENCAFNGCDLEHAFFLGTAEELAKVNVIGSYNDDLTDHFHTAAAGSREPACGLFGYIGYACKECDAICAITRTDKSHHVYESDVCTVCGHAVADDWIVETVEGGVKLTAYNGTDTVIEIPASLGGRKVVALGDNLFKNRSDLEGVTLPETVKSIGSYAFYNCKKLTKLNLPEGITAIEPYTFYNCAELVELQVPSKVTRIGEYAFYCCRKAAQLKVPATLTELGSSAFQSSGITEAVIPQAITEIPNHAFNNCEKLASITLPSGLKQIRDGAFTGAAITKIQFPNGLEAIQRDAFENCRNLKKVVIPNSVTTLGMDAFRGCDTLTDVKLPIDLAELPDRIFWYTNLKNFTIPSTVTKIGQNAIHLAVGESVELPAQVQSVAGNFICASGATYHDDQGLDFTVTVSPANPYLKATEEGVFSKDGKTLYAGFIADPGQKLLRIPDGVETIGSYAYDNFDFGEYQKTLIIPASVKTIGAYAIDVYWEGQIWYLGTEEQWNAIEMDESLRSEMDWNLENSELKLHYASASAAAASCEVGSATLYTCADCAATLLADRAAGAGHSYGADEVCTACGETNTLWTYTVNEGAATVTGYSGVTEHLVLPQALGGCPVTATSGMLLNDWEQQTTVKTVHLPATLKEVGDEAFNYVYSVMEVNFPSGLERIGVGAFRGTSLSSVDLPESVHTLGDRAFGGCQLMEVEISDAIQYGYAVYGGNPIRSATVSGHFTVMENWFANCEYLETVTMPSSITEIGDGAFNGCRSLKNIQLPSGVHTLGASCFSECEALETLTLPSGLQTIGGSAFSNCKSLKELKIPSGVTKVDSYAFSGCKALETIELPANADVSTENLFENCTSLKSVTLPQTLTLIGRGMFYNCENITAFTVRDGILSIDSRAFAGTGITELHLPASVVGIDTAAFFGQDWPYINLTIDPENPYLKIENDALLSKNGEIFHRYLGSSDHYAVPAGVVEIESEAFAESTLKELILPNGLEELNSRFLAHSSVEEITVPNTVERMAHAFWDANRLRLIRLEDGIETIDGYGWFFNCNADVIVPKSVTLMEDWFDDCYGRILYLGTPEDRAQITFDGSDERTLGIWHYVTAESYRAPTCTADGARIFTCSDPTETVEIIIPAAHTFSGNFCSVCGACCAYSAHPYGANTDERKTLTQPGANWMAVTFAEETFVEAGSDFIELYDGNHKLLGRYTGAELAGKRIELQGDTVTVRLLSDDSTEGYGYQVEALDAGVRLTAESGAKLESEIGVIDPDAELVAEVFIPSEEIALPEGSGEAAHFEIHIEKDGEELQPDGSVAISLPVPNGMEGEACEIYRVEQDGTLTDMEAELDENGNLTFKTDHFSHYVVVEMVKTVDTSSVVAILRYLNGIGAADAALDVNGDGKITLADALKLLKNLSA